MGFWEKHLGPAQPPRPTPYQGVLPRGMGQNQDRAVTHYMERQGIPQPPLEPLGEPMGPNGEIPAGDAMRMWQGKEGAQETARTGNCPECGSTLYFSRSSGKVTTAHGVVTPAPECFECGYPRQQGTIDAVVSTDGSAPQPSRQGKMMPVGSLESLQGKV